MSSIHLQISSNVLPLTPMTQHLMKNYLMMQL
jgi:hypothetical protein